MNSRILALALASTTIGLTGCMTDGYGGYGYGSVGSGWGTPYAYDGWYDGYYGSIYDGYWGSDDYFYYRNSAQDRVFRRADRNHFMRTQPRNDDRYRQHRGQFRPEQGMTMPGWRGGDMRRDDRRDRNDMRRNDRNDRNDRRDRPRSQRDDRRPR